MSVEPMPYDKAGRDHLSLYRKRNKNLTYGKWIYNITLFALTALAGISLFNAILFNPILLINFAILALAIGLVHHRYTTFVLDEKTQNRFAKDQQFSFKISSAHAEVLKDLTKTAKVQLDPLGTQPGISTTFFERLSALYSYNRQALGLHHAPIFKFLIVPFWAAFKILRDFSIDASFKVFGITNKNYISSIMPGHVLKKLSPEKDNEEVSVAIGNVVSLSRYDAITWSVYKLDTDKHQMVPRFTTGINNNALDETASIAAIKKVLIGRNEEKYRPRLFISK